MVISQVRVAVDVVDLRVRGAGRGAVEGAADELVDEVPVAPNLRVPVLPGLGLRHDTVAVAVAPEAGHLRRALLADAPRDAGGGGLAARLARRRLHRSRARPAVRESRN